MPSLESIPEEEVLDTSSRQSSSNSKKANSKKTNSKAQSSTESQKTRATAHSKLIKEAKCVGEALKALQPEFDNIVKQFPKNLCERNQDIFVAWRFLIAGVDNCTRWLPKMRSDMNLRLQNPPGEHGMFQVVLRMIFLTQFCSNGFLERTLREIHNASQAAAE